MNNQVKKAEPQKFSTFVRDGKVGKYIADILGDKKNEFVANMSSLVNNNPKLAECDHYSILNCGIVATTLNLPLDPNLGLAYAIPYASKKKVGNAWVEETKAQFQIGYKGIIQLCQRSGQFETINAAIVKEGELIGIDRMTGKHQFEWIEDDIIRDEKPTIGYLAYFKLLNGYEQMSYWSYDKVLNHADEYSQAFDLKVKKDLDAGKIQKKDMWKCSSPWYKSFDKMAQKTVLKLLLNTYAPKSITQLNQALEYDQAVIPEMGVAEYVDNTPENTNEIEYQVEEQTERKEAKEITFDDEKAPNPIMTPSKKMEEAAEDYWGKEGDK